uniref:Uncharacterized protein n=1 Tax=Anguilla anguilla TaxID=7936 RepID=A0A0E9W507_ANGAN
MDANFRCIEAMKAQVKAEHDTFGLTVMSVSIQMLNFNQPFCEVSQIRILNSFCL